MFRLSNYGNIKPILNNEDGEDERIIPHVTLGNQYIQFTTNVFDDIAVKEYKHIHKIKLGNGHIKTYFILGYINTEIHIQFMDNSGFVYPCVGSQVRLYDLKNIKDDSASNDDSENGDNFTNQIYTIKDISVIEGDYIVQLTDGYELVSNIVTGENKLVDDDKVHKNIGVMHGVELFGIDVMDYHNPFPIKGRYDPIIDNIRYHIGKSVEIIYFSNVFIGIINRAQRSGNNGFDLAVEVDGRTYNFRGKNVAGEYIDIYERVYILVLGSKRNNIFK